VGKVGATARTHVVHCTLVAAEEDTALLIVTLENPAFLLLTFHAVVTHKAVQGNAQIFGQPLGIAIENLRGGHSTAVAAVEAVDALFDFLRDLLQLPLDMAVGFQVLAEAGVLLALLLAEPADLD